MKHLFAGIAFAALSISACSPKPAEAPAQPAATPVAEQPTPRWLSVPTPPPLPTPTSTGAARVNGVDLHYAVFGDGPPLIFLHGGLANSEYWGNQVPAFADRYKVILVDSRGHGRSTRDARPYGYDLMADDVVALMDALKIPKASIVGWSDGGIIGLDIAMRHPARLDRLFAFGANTDPTGVMPTAMDSPTFGGFAKTAGDDYRRLSPTPDDYSGFLTQISEMWAKEPNWTAADLGKIKTRTAVVDGDHEEAIVHAHTEQMASQIPGSQLIFLKDASHFAMLQDPEGFNAALKAFLEAP